MVSIGFLYFFLPVFMALYALAGQKYRLAVFLLAGAFVVGWSSLWGLIPIGVSILSGWLSAYVSAKRSRKAAVSMLAAAIILNVASVAVFSYSRFFGAGIAGQLSGHEFSFTGLGFIGAGVCALHSISYSVDVFKGKYERDESFLRTACYIGFFPCFVCGPILRYDKIKEDLLHPIISYDRLAEGIRTLVYGFAEKLVLAAPLMGIWERLSAEKTNELSFVSCWIAVWSFAGSLFFDFKAYCDIAKGLGLMAGFSMPDNFNAPFSAGGFNELIKRFYTTLYDWCREYVYKPLCPHEDRELIHLPAMLCAVMAGLLWLGLCGRYFIWALFFLLIITVEYILKKLLAKTNIVLRAIIMNVLFTGGLPLLIIDSPDSAISFIGRMFSFSGLPGDVYATYVLRTYAILFLVSVFFAFAPAKLIKTSFNQISPNILRIVQPVVQTVLLLVATAYLSVSPVEGFMF